MADEPEPTFRQQAEEWLDKHGILDFATRDFMSAPGPAPIAAKSMEAPNIATARQVVRTQADHMRGVVSNSEQLVNDMLAGGMGNDQQTMSAIQRAQELSDQAAAAWTAAESGMGAHAEGEEYANSGIAAKTEYLQQ